MRPAVPFVRGRVVWKGCRDEDPNTPSFILKRPQQECLADADAMIDRLPVRAVGRRQ